MVDSVRNDVRDRPRQLADIARDLESSNIIRARSKEGDSLGMGERQRVRLDGSRKLPRIRTAPFQGGRAAPGYADEEAHVRVKTLGPL